TWSSGGLLGGGRGVAGRLLRRRRGARLGRWLPALGGRLCNIQRERIGVRGRVLGEADVPLESGHPVTELGAQQERLAETVVGHVRVDIEVRVVAAQEVVDARLRERERDERLHHAGEIPSGVCQGFQYGGEVLEIVHQVLSAAGVDDLVVLVPEVAQRRQSRGELLLLVVDEVHRLRQLRQRLGQGVILLIDLPGQSV